MWFVLTSAHAMSLQAAIDAAEQRSAIVEVQSARVHESELRLHEVQGHLLPSATVSAAAMVQNEVSVNIAENLPDIPLIDTTQISPLVVVPGTQVVGSAEVVQPLIAPQGWAASGAARRGVDLAQAEQRAARVELRRAVVRAWHGSSQARALAADAEIGVQLAERLLERGQAMVELGVASTDQLLPFRGALATAKANLEMARAGSEAADGVLYQLTGLDDGADGAERSTELPELSALLSGLERADLDVAAARVEAAGAAQIVEKRGYLPTLAARGSVVVLDPAPDLGTPLNWKVQLGATIPVFRGGSTRARVQSAGARVSQAEAGRRLAIERAQLEVRSAHGELARAIAALGGRREALDLAEQAVQAAERRSEAGGGSLLAIQQAQAQQLQARAALTRAEAEAGQAADLLALAVKDGV